MIKLESVHIEETRGIRSLDINFEKRTFSISGPNGSGKSGVIDAIEFALTGNIKRLTGSGTKGLSVSEHGPHVDMVKFPDASSVELRVHLQELGKSATIKRAIRNPKNPEVTPDEPEVREILDAIADHPEITLSRRDIIRFILVEPSRRSQEIQALLKLDQLGEMRAALKTASNRLQRTSAQADTNAIDARNALTRHLQIEQLSSELVLQTINEKRTVLGLDPITELTADTKLDTGLDAGGSTSRFNKSTALADLGAFGEFTEGLPELGQEEVKSLLEGIKKVEDDPALFAIIQQRSLIERGLDLVDGPDCPLCDLSWEDEEHLRAHLSVKLEKSKTAGEITDGLTNAGARLAQSVSSTLTKLTAMNEIARAKEIDLEEAAKLFETWRSDLTEFKKSLDSVDGILGQKTRFESGWLSVPAGLGNQIAELKKHVEAVPDQSSIVAAQSFLTTAQVRIEDYRSRMKDKERAQDSYRAGKKAYDVFCHVMEEELNALYDDVQADFSTFYRELNEDDENAFTAKFTPTEGALALDVNFYERGLFPPGAYHSEGHQDGMGVCLYLALMKRLFGDQFSLALLDDVVMSVDMGHRYQFCKLLKAHFPTTQFILTTHDRLWAEQMKSSGLVTAKSSLAFHSWSVDTGPLVESDDEIWDDIDAALTKGKVEVAAASLRRHLEYSASHLCDQLGAQTRFKADGNFELGDLLPAALSRMRTLLGKAASAAQSWGNKASQAAAVDLKKSLSESNGASQVEQWAINKGVHYNNWANFGKTDFQPVVTAFKELLGLFQCDKCSGWLYADNKQAP